MVIQTIRESYDVICTLEGSSRIRAYLCTRMTSPAGEKVLVMAAGEPDLAKKMILSFMELNRTGNIHDFLDCFTKDGTVWVVFRFCEEKAFSEKIEQDYNLKERLAIGKSLAEQIFMQNLPVYLQYEALNERNIVLDDSLAIHVNYLLYEPERMNEDLFQEVLKRTADCFQKLFYREWKEQLSSGLTDFIKKLAAAEFPEGIEVYRAYRDLDRRLKNELEEGKLEGKGYLLRIWEKLKKLSGKLLQLLYALFLAVLLGILVYVCVMPKTAPEDRNVLKKIGTLEVKENGRKTGS